MLPSAGSSERSRTMRGFDGAEEWWTMVEQIRATLECQERRPIARRVDVCDELSLYVLDNK